MLFDAFRFRSREFAKCPGVIPVARRPDCGLTAIAIQERTSFAVLCIALVQFYCRCRMVVRYVQRGRGSRAELIYLSGGDMARSESW